MSTEFSEILDSALEQLRKKDSISVILATYPDQADYLAPLLYAAEALDATAPVEVPPDEVMQMDRVEFLASVEHAEISSVSPSLLVRIKEQMTFFIRGFRLDLLKLRKEKRKMNMLFARALLVFALFFGVTGGGYALTEGSLPDSPLYEAKLAMEQAKLQIKTDPADVAGQHLIIAQHRIQEVIQLAQAGKMPDGGVMTKLENHLSTAFQLAAQLSDDGEMLGVLTQAKFMLQKQIQQMTQTQAQVSSSTQAQLQLMIQLLNQAQNQAELGLQNPNVFRLQFRSGPSPEQPGPGELSSDQDCPNCPCVDCDGEPDQDRIQDRTQNQNQDQDGTKPEPSIQSDGDQDCPNCPCVDCDGEPDQDRIQDRIQNQDQDQDGTKPEPSIQSDGDQDCPNCPCVDCDGEPDQIQDQIQDQAQDQSCDGTQPDQPTPSGPNGDRDCPNCPCVGCDGK